MFHSVLSKSPDNIINLYRYIIMGTLIWFQNDMQMIIIQEEILNDVPKLPTNPKYLRK